MGNSGIADPSAGESPKQRHDRELIELLNELRVALPGVQVLFAFLLAVPFAQGWKRITAFQKDVFLVAFLATAVRSVLLIAPTAYHRLGWRAEDKGRIVAASNKLAIAGLFFLAVSISRRRTTRDGLHLQQDERDRDDSRNRSDVRRLLAGSSARRPGA